MASDVTGMSVLALLSWKLNLLPMPASLSAVLSSMTFCTVTYTYWRLLVKVSSAVSPLANSTFCSRSSQV